MERGEGAVVIRGEEVCILVKDGEEGRVAAGEDGRGEEVEGRGIKEELGEVRGGQEEGRGGSTPKVLQLASPKDVEVHNTHRTNTFLVIFSVILFVMIILFIIHIH